VDDSTIKADFTIGFLGGGQLARMSAVEAFHLGMRVAVFSTGKDDPVNYMTPHSIVGSFDDVDAMIEFAKKCDVITLENEFIDSEILQRVKDESGTPMFPSPDTFKLIENKFIEKETFDDAGIPVAPYALLETLEDAKDFGDEHGWPFILKSSKGGYDGYGNETAHNEEDLKSAWTQLGGDNGHELIAEKMIPFTKELAVQVARNEHGIEVYHCNETVQEDHICTRVITPAPVDEEIRLKAENLAIEAVLAIDGRGVFAFEFFLLEDGELLLNESAPRPHNSGHYSIEGCITSQFENHVRAVTNLPLGSAALRSPVVVMENLLGTHKRPSKAEHIFEAMKTKDAHLHLYGKADSKPGRKMGHLTLLGENLVDSLFTLKQISSGIEI
jgi:5-(carboxyamino)imidazole ribonucleotide synthase